MRASLATLVVVVLAACGSGHSARHSRPRADPTARPRASHNRAQTTSPPAPQALVTAETENRVLVVDLPSGRIARRVPLPPDPEDIATSRAGGVVIVVSSKAAKVTVLDRHSLRPI